MKETRIVCTELELTGAELRQYLEAGMGRKLTCMTWGPDGCNLFEAHLGFVLRVPDEAVARPEPFEPCGCEPFSGQFCETHGGAPELDSREAQ